MRLWMRSNCTFSQYPMNYHQTSFNILSSILCALLYFWNFHVSCYLRYFIFLKKNSRVKAFCCKIFLQTVVMIVFTNKNLVLLHRFCKLHKHCFLFLYNFSVSVLLLHYKMSSKKNHLTF